MGSLIVGVRTPYMLVTEGLMVTLGIGSCIVDIITELLGICFRLYLLLLLKHKCWSFAKDVITKNLSKSYKIDLYHMM